MTSRPGALGLAALVGAAVALTVQATCSFLREVDNQLNNPIKPEWLQILAYRGVLGPSEEVVSVKVFAALYAPIPDASDLVTQNRIEVSSSSGTRQFEWPAGDFSGVRCEVTDLDGDGENEVFFGSPQSLARVVAYRNGMFVFRDCGAWSGLSCDSLDSTRNIEMRDLDADRRVELVAFSVKGPPFDRADPGEPSVWKWSKEKGFYQVPTLVPAYFAKSQSR